MLAKEDNRVSSALLPDALHRLLASRAPGNRLGITLVDKETMLNGNLTALAAAWLTPEERSQLAQFSFEKRRSEWLLGRICAKQSVLELLDGSRDGRALGPGDLTIKVGPSGRPYLSDSDDAIAGLDFSISHSHEKVIGIACRGPCGVDLQYFTDTLFKVKDRFCTGAEMALLDTTEQDERMLLGLLWAAKESIRKSLCTLEHPGFLAMRLERIRRDSGYRLFDFQLDEPFSRLGTVTATTHAHGGYGLAVCTLAGDRPDARTP